MTNANLKILKWTFHVSEILQKVKKKHANSNFYEIISQEIPNGIHKAIIFKAYLTK